MIVKMLGSKHSKGAGAVDYCLNAERVANGTAKVIKGDEFITRSLVELSPYSQKTTFGVLSFAELGADVSQKYKEFIMDEFERVFFGDFMRERANILWVEHTDKGGRLELNFIVNNLDLKSGKSYNPYQFTRDTKRLSAFAEYINNGLNLASPKDPSRRATHNVNTKNKALIKKAERIEQLDEQILEQIALGNITSREQVIDFIKAQGHEVTRVANSTTKNGASISVKLVGTKKANKLKGLYTNESFTTTTALGEVLREYRTEQETYNKRDKRKLLDSYKQFIENGISYLNRELERKYSKYPTIFDINTRNQKELERVREQQEQLTRNAESEKLHSGYSNPTASHKSSNSDNFDNTADNTLMVKDENDTDRERLISAIRESNDSIAKAERYNSELIRPNNSTSQNNSEIKNTSERADRELERAKQRERKREQEREREQELEREIKRLREINEQQSSRFSVFTELLSRFKKGIKNFKDGIKSLRVAILNKQQEQEVEQEISSTFKL